MSLGLHIDPAIACDQKALHSFAEQKRFEFICAKPFPHLVLENFLAEEVALNFVRFLRGAGVLDTEDPQGPVGNLVARLHSRSFIGFLQDLTFIPDMVPRYFPERKTTLYQDRISRRLMLVLCLDENLNNGKLPVVKPRKTAAEPIRLGFNECLLCIGDVTSKDIWAEEVLRRGWKKLLRVQYCAPGSHYDFYSPLPSPEDVRRIRREEKKIFRPYKKCLPAIDLNEPGQLTLFNSISEFYAEQPFPEEKQESLRYYFRHDMYSYADALYLYGMIRHLKPRRIVEIGCGYSSCVMLDTNERYFSSSIQCTFVDPFPDQLLALLKPGDEALHTILAERVQDVDLKLFSGLDSRDILFIDSSHVSKIGSDVNWILFEIFPLLRRGVFIHFHDIFYNFEYPKEWIYAGSAWNEAYLLRAFLQYNKSFSIELFGEFLRHFHRPLLEEKMPLCLKHSSGSLWLKKLVGPG